jgi:xanthine/CO dehydrogenase XdhC/CoxF family maturation factor
LFEEGVMSEMNAIVEAGAALRREGKPGLVATVVRVSGSAFRRPGARMLVSEDGWLAGSVSGGCLEGDVLRRGFWRTEDGPAVVRYDGSGEDDLGWALGTGCNGVVDLLLERHDPTSTVDPVVFAEVALCAQQRGALATVFDGASAGVPVGARVGVRGDGALVTGGASIPTSLRDAMLADARVVLELGRSLVRSYAFDGGLVHALVEAVVPPPRLFVFGTGPDAVAVCDLARTVGWQVFVCEPSVRPSTRIRFHGAAAVLSTQAPDLVARIDASDCASAIVMAHSFDHDRDALAALFGTRVKYIGVLGPRRRTAMMLSELGRDPDGDDRVHAPLGLAIGAETPNEIALAAIAEIQAFLSGASGASLRESAGRIHAEVA